MIVPRTLRVVMALLLATSISAAAIILLKAPAKQTGIPVRLQIAEFRGDGVYLLLADGGLMSDISRGTYGFEILE